jgi:hypothetical protein
MATCSRIDLNDPAARRADPLGIQCCRLVSFNHMEFQLAAQLAEGPFQKRCLAGTGGTNQIQRQYVSAREPTAVSLGELIVFRQHRLIQSDDLALGRWGSSNRRRTMHAMMVMNTSLIVVVVMNTSIIVVMVMNTSIIVVMVVAVIMDDNLAIHC